MPLNPKDNYRDYLGDGLYAEMERGQLKLFTQDGVFVFLEPEVFRALIDYEKRAVEAISQS